MSQCKHMERKVKGGKLSVEQISKSGTIAQGRKVAALVLLILLETILSFNIKTESKIAFDNRIELLIVEIHKIIEGMHTVFGKQRNILLGSNAPQSAI